MSRMRLNDVLFWFGSYEVLNLDTQEEIYHNKLSGGSFTRQTTTIFNKNGDNIALMKNPKLGTPVFRQRISDIKGNIIGEIEPKITLGKIVKNTRETINPYKKDKFLKGAHFADITFQGENYLAESYWPGYREIKVYKENSIVLTLERKFIISEWFDYLVLNRMLFIKKAQYDAVVHDSSKTKDDYALLSLMVRSFFRHKYGSTR